MVGKWIRWPPILCSIPLDQEVKGRTSFGGIRLVKGPSMLGLFTRLSLTKTIHLSLGRAFGGLRLPPKLPSLFGRRHWGRFLHWIILGEDKS